MPGLGGGRLAALLALAMTGGCVLNAVRVESAGDVATKGKVAVAAARVELSRIAAQREALNIDYLALDPLCRPPDASLRHAPRFDEDRPIPAQRPGWLCASTPVEGQTTPLTFEPASEELAPALLLLDAVGTYVDGVAGIVGEDKPDTAADFTDTVALLHSTEGLLRAVARSKNAAVIPPKTDDRITAVAGLIGFIDQLAHEKKQVAELRDLVAHDDSAGLVITRAREMLHDWEVASNADAGNRSEIASFILEKSLGPRPGTAGASGSRIVPPGSDVRRQLLRDYYARADAAADGVRLGAALDAGFGALRDANTTMRDTLREQPNLSAAQRRQLARLTRQRVAAAFDALTAVVTAFAKG